MIDTFQHWISEYEFIPGLVVAFSILLLIMSIFATPWLVSRLPEDYLWHKQPDTKGHPLTDLAVLAARTLVGFCLIAAGLIMLIIPGPGLVTLIAGISLARFPGKRTLLRKIASHTLVFTSLNRMRLRHGRPPFKHPKVPKTGQS
jgi:archaellum biogenesis protein FlaJ (TadC family)